MFIRIFTDTKPLSVISQDILLEKPSLLEPNPKPNYNNRLSTVIVILDKSYKKWLEISKITIPSGILPTRFGDD